MYLEPLDWDSQHFGLKIGKVEVSSLTIDEYHKLVLEKEKYSYDRVYLFLDKKIEFCSDIVPFLADTKVVYHKKLQAIENEVIPLAECYNGELNPELLHLAYHSGHKSRFKTDTKLRHGFESLYKLWIEKSLNGLLADNVFVTKEKDCITGFVTVKINNGHGVIGLIAVSEGHVGKGLGKKLMQTAEQLSIGKNALEMEVATQYENVGACYFYEKLGYEKKYIKYIYHL